jgi:hypothetical protein
MAGKHIAASRPKLTNQIFLFDFHIRDNRLANAIPHFDQLNSMNQLECPFGNRDKQRPLDTFLYHPKNGRAEIERANKQNSVNHCLITFRAIGFGLIGLSSEIKRIHEFQFRRIEKECRAAIIEIIGGEHIMVTRFDKQFAGID